MKRFKDLILTHLANKHILYTIYYKISDFKNVIKYTSSYQAVFDKITSFLKENSNLTIKNTEMLLQGAILINISKEYICLILTTETRQIDITTNLSNTILQIIRRNSEIMKDHAKEKLLLINSIHKVLKGRCTKQKFIKKGLTTHYTDQYQIK